MHECWNFSVLSKQSWSKATPITLPHGHAPWWPLLYLLSLNMIPCLALSWSLGIYLFAGGLFLFANVKLLNLASSSTVAFHVLWATVACNFFLSFIFAVTESFNFAKSCMFSSFYNFIVHAPGAKSCLRISLLRIWILAPLDAWFFWIWVCIIKETLWPTENAKFSRPSHQLTSSLCWNIITNAIFQIHVFFQ